MEGRRDEAPFPLSFFLSLLPGCELGVTGASGLLLLKHVGGMRRGGGGYGVEARDVGQEGAKAGTSRSWALCAVLMMHGETHAEPP